MKSRRDTEKPGQPNNSSGGGGSSNGHGSGSGKACLACRKVKMKCVIKPHETSCERCARKSLGCVVQEHRRGRKHGTRILKKRPAPPQDDAQPQDSSNWRTNASQSPDGGVSKDLQPPGLLNSAATQGRFSLDNILNPAVNEGSTGLHDSTVISSDDPIRLGCIDSATAESLFEKFMSVLNPLISQLDSVLHTMAYVRLHSAFLFTTMLATTAKMFCPSVHPALHRHAETLMANCFMRGEKSPEIAQAMMIMTYWKEPDDTRAWLLIGYVIRMGMDLGWHLCAHRPNQDGVARDGQKQRELRNIQRTWYVLFVYDRSLNLQTGKPWMIEPNGFIQSIERWCEDPMVSANDQLLGAFVTIRLLGSEVFQLVRSDLKKAKSALWDGIEPLLLVLESQLETWEHRWTPRVAGDERHMFMIKFYVMHLRLQLYSLPLQGVLASNDPSLSANLGILWTSYSSALEMLELICKSSEFLCYVQDSVHVMTAYSAAFLIQFLLSAPESITVQIEPKVVQTIRATPLVFAQQMATATSSCALQARFLERMLSNFAQTRTGNGLVGAMNTTANTLDRGGVDISNTGGYASHSGPLYSDLVALDQNSGHTAPVGLLLEQNETWDQMFAYAGFDFEEGIFFA